VPPPAGRDAARHVRRRREPQQSAKPHTHPVDHGGRDVAAVCSKIIKVVVDLGTLFGGRVVGCAREDVRDPAGQPKRMGTMFSKMRLARGVE
jgi:hypothetical protein